MIQYNRNGIENIEMNKKREKTKNKIPKLGLFLIGLIMFLITIIGAKALTLEYSLRFNGWCYQETSTSSTSCGGLSTGSYNAVNDYLYINYTIPNNTVSAKWYVKHNNGVDVAPYNITIPSSCLNYSTNKLQLRFYSHIQNGPDSASSYGQCNNGSWITISNVYTWSSTLDGSYIGTFETGVQARMYDGDWNTGALFDNVGIFWTTPMSLHTGYADIWEEAMWWNISIDMNKINYSFSPNTTLMNEQYTLYLNTTTTEIINHNNSLCYQESANASSNCGGLNTGNYAYDNNWTIANPAFYVEKTYDGSWNTGSFPKFQNTNKSNGSAYIWINYTKPTNVSNALWMVRYSSNTVYTTNISVPSSCLNDTVQLRVAGNTHTTSSTTSNTNYTFSCYNGTNFQVLLQGLDYSDSGTGSFYEEAMWWNITGYTTNYNNIITQARLIYNNTDYGIANYTDNGYNRIFSKNIITNITGDINYKWNITITHTTGEISNFTLDGNITLIYKNNISIKESDTGLLMSGINCSLNNTYILWGTNPYILNNIESVNFTCSKTNYVTKSWIINAINNSQNLTLYLEEEKLRLYIKSSVNGSITFTNGSYTFNNATYIVKQTSMPEGKIIVRWNANKQVMEYWNNMGNGNNEVAEYLDVIAGDLNNVRTIIVRGDGAFLQNARITAEAWNGTRWLVTYGRLTDENGQAVLYFETNKDYKITAQADGYTSANTLISTSATDTTNVIIDLTSSSGTTAGDSIKTTCPAVINSNISCGIQILCGDACSSVQIIINRTYRDGSSDLDSQQITTSTGNTFTTSFNENMNNAYVSAYVDGVMIYNWTYILNNWEIDRNMTNVFTEEELAKDEDSAKLWILALAIAGIILGGIFEAKVRRGTGVYATAIWWLLWTFQIPILGILGGLIIALKIGFYITGKVSN